MSSSPTRSTELGFGIVAIDVEFARPLMAASHLIVDDGHAAFVDTGTNSSVPALLHELEARDIAPEQVDYVLLTHIHLDHAGGAGALMQALPAAQLVVHPRGARHMADPTRLIDGVTAVYGEATYRELYGQLLSIDSVRIKVTTDAETLRLGGRELVCLHTEGHARHHQCFHDSLSNGIFAGDSFGVSYRELDTEQGEFIFSTTTPVQFDPEAAHATIDRLIARQPRCMYLTHFSEVSDIGRLADDLHTSLDVFVALAREFASHAKPQTALANGIYRWLSERLDAHGFAHDPARRHAILDMDCDLNAQGLMHWLDHSDS